MRQNRCLVILLLVAVAQAFAAPPTAPAVPADPLNRLNPRSSLTAFLQACHSDDYGKASQYLDLAKIPAKQRAEKGPEIAKDLESLLNSASRFDVLRISQDPAGNLNDDPDPAIERVTDITSNDQTFTLELQRVQSGTGPAIWLFSANTVAKVPELTPVPSTESAIEARLPRFLVTTLLLETPLWKWIALLILTVALFGVFRLLVQLSDAFRTSINARLGKHASGLIWLQAIVDPLIVLLTVLVFRIVEELIRPAAFTRVYIGRALLLVVVASLAWGLINLLDYLVVRFDRTLNFKQRLVSQSVIYLGRRTLKTVISIFAAILVFDNWGFNMTTIIAGLGVGGIAVALAAQQTIANVFGGVSVIGDAPVMVGDFGNFGGVIGTIEDIGLRSARVRTLTRTVVSIPNSAFAGMNLENYTVRDKMLFNPTFTIKRQTPKEQVEKLMSALHDMLAGTKNVAIGPVPVRITNYTAASFTIELFAYVLTSEVDEYYKHQASLYLAMEQVVSASGVELV